MTEIAHDALDAHLQDLEPGAAAPAFLVHGEEMLCQKATQVLIRHLLGPEPGPHQLERLDGAMPGATAEALARVNTYSLLGDTKVVILAEARVFHDSLDSRAFLESARVAQQEKRLDKAAKALMAVLGFHRLAPAEVDADARRRLLTAADLDPQEDQWLDDLISWCRQQDLAVPAGDDAGEALVKALERGFPSGQHLVVTAERVDRRRRLYKAFAAAGVVVDCTVPAGDRMADREIQQRVLQGQMRAVLASSGKRMDPGAYAALVEMTGFDLRSFTGGLQKLIDYSGERPTILAEDVGRVLSRSRQDPIYALTGAVGEGRLDLALQALGSLLAGGHHPLQVLGALVNQVRRWLLARSFLDGPGKGVWQPQMRYADFQRLVLPLLKDQDRRLREAVAAWSPEQAGGKNRRRDVDTDLILVKNPQSTYPVFQLLKQSQRFSSRRLEASLERLVDADRSLKGGSASARLVLEALLFFLCQKGEDGVRVRRKAAGEASAA